MRAAATEKEMNAAYFQRINDSAHAEAPQRQVDVEALGSLHTCMRSGSSPPDGEAEACVVKQLPSRSWCLDETLPCTFG